MRLEIEGGDPPFGPDDYVETTDAVRRGDVVWFERIGPNRLVVRHAPEDPDEAFPHPRWRIDRGSEPGTLRFSRVDEAPT